MFNGRKRFFYQALVYDMTIDMRSYILKLHGLCMHSFYSILLVNQDASTLLSMCIRAAHIKEDVPWIFLPANVDVQFSHATICRQPKPDPSCGVEYDCKEKRVSEVIKGTVPTKCSSMFCPQTQASSAKKTSASWREKMCCARII